MANVNALSDLIRQQAFYNAGGQEVDSLDKFNKVLDTANKGITGYQDARKSHDDIIMNVLKKKQAELGIGETQYQQAPEQRDLGRRDTEAGIGLKEAQAKYYGAGARGGSRKYINPITREWSDIPQPGYIEVSANTAATIASQPTKEAATADRQEELQKRGAEISEAKENRAKYKDEFNKMEQLENSVVSAKDLLSKVTPGIVGRGESLVAKSGYMFPEAATYDGNINALAVDVYRAMTGDTRLSDQDAASRALPLLPKIGEDSNQQAAKWKVVDEKIAFRKQQLERGIQEVPWETKSSTAPSVQTPATVSPPKVGEIKKGYAFKGGNPTDQKNWIKVNQ